MAGEQFDKTLSDEAIAWFVLLESGGATLDDYHEFAQWRACSSDHKQAFDNINALWNDLDGLKDERVQSPLPQAFSEHMLPVTTSPASVNVSWSRWVASLCILLVCVVSVPFLGASGMTYLASDYRTGIGEQTTITLVDGSRVMLDADSALSVDYSKRSRQLTLHRGRGYFIVALDKQRPFVVISDNGQTQALGTEFEVAKNQQGVAVTVFESAVQVSLAEKSEHLASGQRLYYSSETGVSMPQVTDLQQAGGWRRGKLVFTDRPLSEVIDEINRYRQGVIVIVDESLAHFPVSGVFDLTHPDAILQTLVEVLPIRQRSLTPFLVLLDRSS